MKGLLYKTHSNSNEDGFFEAGNFYCVEMNGKKIHVIESWRNWEDASVQLIGPCDKSCCLAVELSESVEDVVMGRTLEVVEGEYVSTHWFFDKFIEEVEEEPMLEKVVAKINRWSKRYRWTRQRRLVTNFS